MTIETYKSLAKLASSIHYRANKIANLNFDDASQCEVIYEEEQFYFTVIEFLNCIATEYEHNPNLNLHTRYNFDVSKIRDGINKLL